MSSCDAIKGRDSSRQSSYEMISVDRAIEIVLSVAQKSQKSEFVSLGNAAGRIIADDIFAVEPFPPYPASIMDGYAVIAPLTKGVYPVQSKTLAGDLESQALSSGFVSYITTGAVVPDNANAVVKIEDTESVDSSTPNEKYVKIAIDVAPNENVRSIGSDIKPGEMILKKGTLIGPAEIGLLATIGLVDQIPCYGKPIIGVMSTGNELVEATDNPLGSQIRDSNRPTLIAAFEEDGYTCIDLGIVRDVESDLRDCLLDAASRCDIVITSGGVSMGAADFVKPLLNSLGKIHFGRLNMKPGKPTTFATVQVAKGDHIAATASREVMFFGLPGNPVSCLVTKTLVVDPACKRFQGLDSSKCMHAQVRARFIGPQAIPLDAERPEYHRVILSFDGASGECTAVSTGNQRSSRLLSMCSANALVCLPAGTGRVEPGSLVDALLLRPIAPPHHSACFHVAAASLDFGGVSSSTSQPSKSIAGREYESFSTLLKPPVVQNSTGPAGVFSPASDKGEGWKRIRTALLTISDRAFEGKYKDESGPEMATLLSKMSDSQDWPLVIDIVQTALVADEIGLIQQNIIKWTQGGDIDLILTSGGTGFGLRDLTPEAIRPLLTREAPGVAQALLNEGLKYTPLAVLSRPVVGTRNKTFICTLPGSVKAVRENIAALKPLLPRIMELLKAIE